MGKGKGQLHYNFGAIVDSNHPFILPILQPVQDERKRAARPSGMGGIKGMGYFGNSLKNRFDNSEMR